MISVVIAAFNEEKTLKTCLDSLFAQTASSDSYEIIVADDGSSDGTREVAGSYCKAKGAQAPAVEVVSQSNQGPGAARNLGARHARGDVLLFIDADSAADPRLVEKMAAVFADPAIAGASGEKKTLQTNLWARYVQIEYDYKYERLARHPTIDFVDSSTAGYRREVFLSSGGFDTSLEEAEDTELSFRLSERGCRLVLVPEAITWHSHPESPVRYLWRKFQYARGRVNVYARYPRKAMSDQRTPMTQKVQPFIAYAFVPAFLGAFVWIGFIWLLAALVVLFLATTWDLMSYFGNRSRPLALLVPAVVWLSAYATGAGALLGLLQTRAKMG